MARPHAHPDAAALLRTEHAVVRVLASAADERGGALRVDAGGATLVVATKATGLDPALERVRGVPELVVPLLNGLDHLDLLRARWGERVAAASIRIESDRPAPSRIVQTSEFLRIDVAPPSPAVERFAMTMRAAGVPVDVLASEANVMWGKLVRLNALACTTSALDLPLGPIRSDPERRALLRACVDEAAAAARAEGADADPDRTMAELDAAHATLSSSMRRDIAAGREPELDAIPGSVLRAAARHGLACPTIATLAERIAARAGVPTAMG
jgi:2-dehydropantoate 2-reductase